MPGPPYGGFGTARTCGRGSKRNGIPAALTRTRDRTRSGRSAARRIAICPPIECPMTCTGSPNVSIHRASSDVTSANAGRSTGSPKKRRFLPKPIRSTAATRWRDASASKFRDHQRDDPLRPCSRTTGVPEPARVSHREYGGKSRRVLITRASATAGPAYLRCRPSSTIRQRSCTTWIPASASVCAASSLRMPSWNQTYFGFAARMSSRC